MKITRNLLLGATAVAILSGCQTNPYQDRDGSTNKTAVGATVGTILGAAAGAVISHDNRGKGAAIGAAVGGLAGGSYGYYADKQEEALRQQMQGTGVDIQREGDNIQLIMPGSITFATNSAQITPGFYNTLNNLANTLRQYDQNSIDIVGHTDSTGNYNYNMQLSQQRAQSVASYLASQGVPAARISTSGVGPSQPVADNRTEAGRLQNRRVEITLRPLANPQYQ